MTDQADDQTIVILVRPVVKKGTSFMLTKRLNNGLDHVGISSLAEVWNAFNELIRHSLLLLRLLIHINHGYFHAALIGDFYSPFIAGIGVTENTCAWIISQHRG